MKINPFITAARAKGPLALYHRSRSIAEHYGITATRMEQALQRFSEVLQWYSCGATFPITAVTLKRHTNIIEKYSASNIEFAVHGFTHIDYSELSSTVQLAHLQHARKIFSEAGITPLGFRSPYLRRDDSLYSGLESAGFLYVSNQPILWETLDHAVIHPTKNPGYQRALDFYNPLWACEHLSLPHLINDLVEIPVSLPDDEILVERLGVTNSFIQDTWQRILTQTYQRGELFTLQLHPERVGLCSDGVSAVLSLARALTPAIWCARLDEIAVWWKARSQAVVGLTQLGDGKYHCRISAPPGSTVLARGLEIDAPTSSWSDGYQEVKALDFTFRSGLVPIIGLSPYSPINLVSFLQQQGYIIETSPERDRFTYYLDQKTLDPDQEQLLLSKIEATGKPLLRLGRWPNGAKSALAITGDIDAMTLWDYGLRLFGY